MDDQILSEFLDNAVQQAKSRITQEGRLSTEDAIPLMLKSQFNHIAHLEQEMVTRADFNGLKDQFTGLKDQFTGLKDQFTGLKDQFTGLKDQVSFLKWGITAGFTFLAILQVYVAFIK